MNKCPLQKSAYTIPDVAYAQWNISCMTSRTTTIYNEFKINMEDKDEYDTLLSYSDPPDNKITDEKKKIPSMMNLLLPEYIWLKLHNNITLRYFL